MIAHRLGYSKLYYSLFVYSNSRYRNLSYVLLTLRKVNQLKKVWSLRQNVLTSFFLQIIYFRRSILKEFLEGIYFFGFCHSHWWNPYSAITSRATPQKVTPTRLAKYIHVDYATSTSEKYPCMHHSPMHPTSCTHGHQHACTPEHGLCQYGWRNTHACGYAIPPDGTLWLRESLWRNTHDPCGSANSFDEIPLIYMRKLERKMQYNSLLVCFYIWVG